MRGVCFLISFLLIILSSSIFACESGHWLKSKSYDGGIVILENNSVWEVDSIDKMDSALWLPIANIVVCNYELINIDTGDKVGARQIR